MSMYHLFCEVNPLADSILESVGLVKGNVPRFRDAHLLRDGTVKVLTRVGGNNRVDYQEQIDALRAAPTYISDEDCDYDNTYADFYFRVKETG